MSREDVRAAGVQVDDGGRPITDAGGRLVYYRSDTDEYVLDNAGTPATEPLSGDPVGSAGEPGTGSAGDDGPPAGPASEDESGESPQQ